MNPYQASENAGLNLPPVPEQLPPQTLPEPAATLREAVPSRPETNLSPPVQAPVLTSQPSAVSLPQQPQTQATTTINDVTKTTSTDVPNTAHDEDLIEKVWVNKAKAIVNRTKEDPYQQSRELSTFKAEYIQKRYNKALKVSE